MQLVMYEMTPVSGQADRECGPAAREVLVAIIADGRRIHILFSPWQAAGPRISCRMTICFCPELVIFHFFYNSVHKVRPKNSTS